MEKSKPSSSCLMIVCLCKSSSGCIIIINADFEEYVKAVSVKMQLITCSRMVMMALSKRTRLQNGITSNPSKGSKLYLPKKLNKNSESKEFSRPNFPKYCVHDYSQQ